MVDKVCVNNFASQQMDHSTVVAYQAILCLAITALVCGSLSILCDMTPISAWKGMVILIHEAH